MERWSRRFGAAEVSALGEQYSPSLALRPNSLRIAPAALIEKFSAAGIAAESPAYPE